MGDSRHETRDSRLGVQDSRLEMLNLRVEAEDTDSRQARGIDDRLEMQKIDSTVKR